MTTRDDDTTAQGEASDPFNCPSCGAHDWGLHGAPCVHCGHPDGPEAADPMRPYRDADPRQGEAEVPTRDEVIDDAEDWARASDDGLWTAEAREARAAFTGRLGQLYDALDQRQAEVERLRLNRETLIEVADRVVDTGNELHNVKAELADKERLLADTDHWIAFQQFGGQRVSVPGGEWVAETRDAALERHDARHRARQEGGGS